MDFKNVPKEYRPIPFWSWNEKLEPEETKRQIHMMDEVGIGGFFMHARGGLQTEYMGEEWFENVSASIEAADECGMKAWAYDENGWPSGFGGGIVNGLGLEYQQKYLRMEETHEHIENEICKCGDHWFYYEVNPFYVDTLDKKVIAKFIDVIYKPYYEKYGNKVEGFFTDEPQISRSGIPWSFVYEEEYKQRYNEDIKEHLEELFLPVGDYVNTRIKFWKMTTDLFSSSYMKQIYDWCDERGIKFTGHLVLEDTPNSQLVSNGACMPHYEYLHMPGMDWLGRDILDVLTLKQLSSVAEQLGKDHVLSETFALCGHNVSLEELKGIFEWQLVNGITRLCQHLEGYSLRGIRKRDYPPAMYYQQPWWKEYKAFVDAMSREGMILSKGKKQVDVLLMHPQTTAWVNYDDNTNNDIYNLHDRIIAVMKKLDQKHIQYHFGDETLMERHARVENGKLIIGKQSYSVIINSDCIYMLDNTKTLLDEFVKQGGKIITNPDELPANDITDNPDITYTKRIFDEYNVHYFVNTSPDRKQANITTDGLAIDIFTGELKPFCSDYEFEPWGSLMVVEGTEKPLDKSEPTLINIDGKFKLSADTKNILTLDRCDYYFDGKLQEKNGYVLNICARANALKRKVNLHQGYHITINEIPAELKMLCETPEIFKISVNGKEINNTPIGWYIDKSFKEIDIQPYVKQGENVISFDCEFDQTQRFYDDLEKSHIFESEKNKLAYDMEIEAIYLVGNFAVKTDGEWTHLDKNALRYKGDFKLDKLPEYITLKNIEQQGFPFFCGELNLEGEIEIVGKNPVLVFDKKGINCITAEINGIKKTVITDNRMSLSDFNSSGKTGIKLTLLNNLRNMLGPHHLKCGESYMVGPSDFFKEPCVWNFNPEKNWDDDYCFVETNL